MMAARTLGRLALWAAGLAFGVVGFAAAAQEGNAERGEGIYARRCIGCHGADGDGLGPAAERLNPPPRDFTLGQYKIKSSAFDEPVVNDGDVLRTIRDGMPGTAMPGWGDVLSGQEIQDLIAYLKTFAELEDETPSGQVDYGSRIASSAESIEKGRELFHQDDRCAECHGQAGKGDAVKKLKDDNRERTWPRNLTKPWTFRASNDPKDVFTRISVGIPGTQMPSFADPKSKKKLGIEQRWHLANYVASLAKTEKVVRPRNTVISAEKVDGALPDAPDDAKWLASAPTTFFLVPQMIAKTRLFTPTNDTITVRALYNEKNIALLIEWDDRTRSIPGDPEAEKLSEPGLASDAVSVQLPVTIPDGQEKPYFGMGDTARPVNIWQWKSATAERPESVGLMNGRGFREIEKRDAAAVGLRATGRWDKGTWRVVMTRPRTPADPEKDLRFVEGRLIPVAFAAWDGSNGETGSKHTMTTWYWLLLKPPTGARPALAALLAFLLIGAGEFWWARGAARKPRPKGRHK